MKTILTALFAVLASAAFADSGKTPPAQNPAGNWGQVTSTAIAGGFDQGTHASSFAGAPRTGLANVVNQGDLSSTITLVAPSGNGM